MLRGLCIGDVLCYHNVVECIGTREVHHRRPRGSAGGNGSLDPGAVLRLDPDLLLLSVATTRNQVLPQCIRHRIDHRTDIRRRPYGCTRVVARAAVTTIRLDRSVVTTCSLGRNKSGLGIVKTRAHDDTATGATSTTDRAVARARSTIRVHGERRESLGVNADRAAATTARHGLFSGNTGITTCTTAATGKWHKHHVAVRATLRAGGSRICTTIFAESPAATATSVAMTGASTMLSARITAIEIITCQTGLPEGMSGATTGILVDILVRFATGNAIH